MPQDKLCYTVSETAKILSVSGMTLYRLIETGKLQHRRIGRKILIDRDTIETFGKVM